MPINSVEKRAHYRRNHANVIEYVVTGRQESGPFKGVTINMSETGLCFFTYTPISENVAISIVKSTLPLHCKTGTIRWVKALDTDFYKIGVMFAQD